MDMFDNFREHSIAEFFKKNRQMLGFSGKTRSLTTIVHEYVTNSLDACDEAGILPYIKVELREVDKDRYKVIVQDNGPGIPKELIGKALGMMLAGTKFHRFIQQRGQQGIGAAGCTMYALLTTGKPVHVISGHNGKIVSCDVSIDFKTNKPVITNLSEREGEMHGLIVEGEFANVKYDKGIYGVYEYLKRTAIANPHATIVLRANGELHVFKRSVEEIPAKPKEVKPHPLGLEPHDLLDYAKQSKAKRLSSFLINDFVRVSQAKVDELRRLLPHIDFSKPPKDLTWKEAEELVKAIRKLKWISPPMEGVIPIGKSQIEKSMMAILKPEFLSVVERKPKLYRGGVPFIVEAAIAYGGEAKPMIMRFANRAPLLFDNAACAITNVVKKIDWKRYGIDNIEEEPVAIFVNISSVHIPYISAGKTAIADEEEIVQEIKNAIQEAARDIKISISRKKKAKEVEKKRKAILRYVERLSESLAEMVHANKEELKQRLIEIIERKYDYGRPKQSVEVEEVREVREVGE